MSFPRFDLKPFRRHTVPSIPDDVIDAENPGIVQNLLSAMRERLQIYGRERGRIEDSMVSVQDLIDLGIITDEQALTLRRVQAVRPQDVT